MNPFIALRDHAKEVYDTLSGNERIKERTRGLYDQVVNRGIKPSFPMLLKDPQNVTMDDLIASGFGVMPMAIKAYHGSPHLFDKFDMSKIGTGEGNQTYGHGLYMAENPDVAMSYRASTTNGFGLPDGNKIQGVANAIALKGEDFARKNYSELGDELEATIAKAKKAIDENSNLYETSLQWPDPAREAADPMGPQHYLNTDESIDDQSEFINNIFNKIKQDYPNVWKDAYNSGYANNLYDELSFELGSGNKASEYLKKQGIPGIRYLDQGSRGAGQGSYNYVVFDDSIPKIVKRNGKPVK